MICANINDINPNAKQKYSDSSRSYGQIDVISIVAQPTMKIEKRFLRGYYSSVEVFRSVTRLPCTIFFISIKTNTPSQIAARPIQIWFTFNPSIIYILKNEGFKAPIKKSNLVIMRPKSQIEYLLLQGRSVQKQNTRYYTWLDDVYKMAGSQRRKLMSIMCSIKVQAKFRSQALRKQLRVHQKDDRCSKLQARKMINGMPAFCLLCRTVDAARQRRSSTGMRMQMVREQQTRV